MSRKLYYSGLSPYGRKVRILLAELSLEYESDRADRLRTVTEISQINPNLSIPVFEEKNIILFDSTVICEYLFETYGHLSTRNIDSPPLYSRVYRETSKWEDMKLLATLETLTESLVSVFLYGRSISDAGANPENVEYLGRQKVRIGKILDWLESRAFGNGFYRDCFALPDIIFIAAVGLCDAIKLYDWKGRPNLEALVEYFTDRNSIRLTSP